MAKQLTSSNQAFLEQNDQPLDADIGLTSGQLDRFFSRLIFLAPSSDGQSKGILRVENSADFNRLLEHELQGIIVEDSPRRLTNWRTSGKQIYKRLFDTWDYIVIDGDGLDVRDKRDAYFLLWDIEEAARDYRAWSFVQPLIFLIGGILLVIAILGLWARES